MKKMIALILAILTLAGASACTAKPQKTNSGDNEPKQPVASQVKEDEQEGETTDEEMFIKMIKDAGILSDEEFEKFKACEEKAAPYFEKMNELQDKGELSEDESKALEDIYSKLEEIFSSEMEIYNKVDKYMQDSGMFSEGEGEAGGMDEQKELTKDLSNFSTTDAKDKAVTQDIFKDKDITMVNVWATWCGACIAEMGDLQKLYAKLPDNVGMISICEDLKDNSAAVEKILKENGCQFTTIAPDKNIKDGLLKELQFFPTTIFVDKDGKIVGKPIIGAPGGDVAEGYMAAINKALEQIKK